MGTNLQQWWDNGNYQIAFGRGNRGFVAFNLEGYDLNQDLQTGLPQGTYCDVISGNYDNGACTGTEINVGGDGRAHFHISNNSDDPMIAIHIGLLPDKDICISILCVVCFFLSNSLCSNNFTYYL